MSEPAPAPRVWKRVTLALIGLWVVYLLAANLFLGTAIGNRLLNQKPEKRLVTWGRAWSVVPGLVHVRDFRIRVQSRQVQWEATLDEATVPVVLPALVAKSFRTIGVRASGVEFRLRRRIDKTPEAAAGREASFPDIPGLANPPSPAPEALYEPTDNRWTWRVVLKGLGLREIREIWIDSSRLLGTGELEADFSLRARKELELSRSSVDFQSARLEVGGEPIAENLLLSLDATIDPLVPRQYRGVENFRFMSGVVEVEGKISNLGALDSIFRSADWLSLSTTGDLRAIARLELGELASGTRVTIDDASVASTLPATARRATARWSPRSPRSTQRRETSGCESSSASPMSPFNGSARRSPTHGKRICVSPRRAASFGSVPNRSLTCEPPSSYPGP